MWSLCTIWDLTYLLIALLLLSKVRIFFNGNLDGSLSRRTPLLIRFDFSLFIRSCNFPVWFMWPSDMYSDCVLFCLATRVFWLDFINGMDLYNGGEISFSIQSNILSIHDSSGILEKYLRSSSELLKYVPLHQSWILKSQYSTA